MPSEIKVFLSSKIRVHEIQERIMNRNTIETVDCMQNTFIVY